MILNSRREPKFNPLPGCEGLQLAWPTPNRNLFNLPESFFARTRVNPEYGKPGWTRDCGKRFHFGCDIAPVKPVPTGRTTEVAFTDCATGKEFKSKEATWLCDDAIFSIADGIVVDCVSEQAHSTFGLHVLIKHELPDRYCFYSLYAHLHSLTVILNQHVKAGQSIGVMGQSSSSEDARNWMSIAPHLHLEIHDETGVSVDPAEFLRAYLPH